LRSAACRILGVVAGEGSEPTHLSHGECLVSDPLDGVGYGEPLVLDHQDECRAGLALGGLNRPPGLGECKVDGHSEIGDPILLLGAGAPSGTGPFLDRARASIRSRELLMSAPFNWFTYLGPRWKRSCSDRRVLIWGRTLMVHVRPQAAEGNGQAYGAVVQQCLGVSVGDAIAAGKVAHPGIKMTAKTIAQSPHCA
jgi:hypothetical protein